MRKTILIGAALAAGALAVGCASTPSTGPLSFFVSPSSGANGGNLGGLAGADAICQRAAAAVGAGGKTWRAYLSTQGTPPSANSPGVPFVHARDRIGKGPWYNAKGVLVARDVAHLHNGNNINKGTALDERGNPIRARGEPGPLEHDILTGSRADGTAFSHHIDMTCKGWTSSTDGSAIIGHHDRNGPTTDAWSTSWNFSHPTAGCSQQALASTGGAGRFYCFASN